MNCSLCRLNLFCELRGEAQPPTRDVRTKICRSGADVCRHRLHGHDYKAATPYVNEARRTQRKNSGFDIISGQQHDLAEGAGSHNVFVRLNRRSER